MYEEAKLIIKRYPVIVVKDFSQLSGMEKKHKDVFDAYFRIVI